MDYYCRRYKFGQVELAFTSTQGGQKWECTMSVNESRIGVGVAGSKKTAQVQCYLDVTKYLESCDPALWQSFREAEKTGANLGLAPPVLVRMSDGLENRIQDLSYDMRNSALYRNRPVSAAPTASTPDAELTHLSSRFASQSNLQLGSKSENLAARRKRYLEIPDMEKMRNTRKALPMYSRAEDVLKHIEQNEVSICMAATGSGKTTQLPQLILDHFIDKGEGAECNIVCTQPRRLAAISVAHRVANERGEALGASIGYHVRFDQKLPEENGSVTFCTTGVFLKKLQSALSSTDVRGRSQMDKITHIIVDEVHERDVDTDLLLVVLKRVMADRRARNVPLKIILMSATVDPTLFQTYFKDQNGRPSPVIEVPGRAYPVEKRFMEDYLPQLASGPSRWVLQQESVANYLHQQLGAPAAARLGAHATKTLTETTELELPYPLIAATICHTLEKSDDGHVLVFLPGWEEIVATQKALQQPLGHLPVNINDSSKYSVHLLHSSIPLAEQQVIFEPPPPGIRRVILATNIAETSVTIPDVVYVVDTAKIKENRYEPERHMTSLVSTWVGTSNLNQRAGRAGRHRPGIYYGLLSKSFANSLHPHQAVEMKRVDLSNVVMHIKALNFPGMSIKEVLQAAIEPPEAVQVESALKVLNMVGALDQEENLTPLGRVLLALPVDVQMGRLVLYGTFFRCLDPALTMAAILTNRDPFVRPAHVKQEAQAKKASWSPPGFRSDVLATLRAYNAWWDIQSRGRYGEANQFCFDNFLAKPTLVLIQKIKQQMLESLYRAGVLDVVTGPGSRSDRHQRLEVPPEARRNDDCYPLLAGLVAVASQPKFAIRTGDNILRTALDKTVFIHPSSVNSRLRGMAQMEQAEEHEKKEIYAYSEKRRNTTTGGPATTYLVNTTRLDPLVYLMFGAYNAKVTSRGLECDEWLPIVGDVDALDVTERLKTYMDKCFLRVYEGIVASRRRSRDDIRFVPREREDEEDYDGFNDKDYTLSSQEIKDLDWMTQNIVDIVTRANQERTDAQSRANSRPGTPTMGFHPRSGTRSGYSTPGGFQSRPSTPSGLSRQPYLPF